MKSNTNANRKMSRRYFIIIGIILCFFIFGAVNAEAEENKTVILPSTITGDTAAGFDGGTCPAPYKDVIGIDIVNAFIGENREYYFVAIPQGRFITFSFPDNIKQLTEGILTIETTGADGATSQVSALLNDNTEQILGSIRETQTTQITTFSLDQECIRNLKAIKIEGTNNAGQYDGADVVSIYIESDVEEAFLVFNCNKGYCDIDKKPIKYGEKYGTLPAPTRDGYAFKGWYTSKTSSKKVTKDTVFKSNKNITVYAQWIKTYKVKYKLNGGKGSIKNQTKKKGKNLKLSSKKPTRTGYTFKGWSTKKDGDVKYNAGATYKADSSVTLYAKWKKKPKREIYVLIYGAAKGETPSSTNNVNMMYRALKQLKVPGYTINEKNVIKVNKKRFKKAEFLDAIDSAFKKAAKNDLCFVYLNTHSKGVNDTKQKIRDYYTGELKDKIKYYGLATGEKKSNYYSWEKVLSDMGKRIKGKIIFMPEVCNSGKFIKYVSKTDIEDRITILAAAEEDDGARQTELLFFGGGHYTQALSAGLGFYWKTPIEDRLVADKNKNGEVTIEELYAYILKDRRIKKSGQSPQLYVPKTMKSFILYKQN